MVLVGVWMNHSFSSQIYHSARFLCVGKLFRCPVLVSERSAFSLACQIEGTPSITKSNISGQERDGGHENFEIPRLPQKRSAHPGW